MKKIQGKQSYVGFCDIGRIRIRILQRNCTARLLHGYQRALGRQSSVEFCAQAANSHRSPERLLRTRSTVPETASSHQEIVYSYCNVAFCWYRQDPRGARFRGWEKQQKVEDLAGTSPVCLGNDLQDQGDSKEYPTRTSHSRT